MDWITGWFNDTIRSIMWDILHVILWLMNSTYDIMQKLFGLNLNNFSWIWSWFTALSALLVLFIFIRLILMYMKTMWDDEAVERIDGFSILKRMVGIGFIMLLIPAGLPALSSMSADLTTKFPSMVNMSNTDPSDVILGAGLTDMSVSIDDASNADTVAQLKADVGLSSEDSLLNYFTRDNINEKNSENKYKYFPDGGNLLLTGVLGGMAVYCFVFVAVQIASRAISLLFKIILAPYALSGLVDAKDTGTSTWFKLCVADILGNFFQMALVWLVLYACATVQLDALSKGIFFIGALFTIMHAPAGVAQLIGSDIGTSAGIQSLAQLKAFGGALKTGVAAGGAMLGAAGGAALTQASGAIYGIGRMRGGASMNPNSFLGGNGSSGGSGTGSAGSGDSSVGSSGLSGTGMPSYGDAHTENQLNAAQVLNVSGAENMSKGELSQALESAGADRSFFDGTEPSSMGTMDLSDNSISGGSSGASGGMSRSFGQMLYASAGQRWYGGQNGSKRVAASNAIHMAAGAGRAIHQKSVTSKVAQAESTAKRFGL